MNYKTLLENSITDTGLRLVGRHSGYDWWIDELWELEYPKTSTVLWVTFLISALHEPYQEKKPLIDSVIVSTNKLTSRLDRDSVIAELCMTKRRFDEKLAELERQLAAFLAKHPSDEHEPLSPQ